MYTDTFHSYDAIDVSEFRNLRKLNGISKEHLGPYLKECERHFNNSEIESQIQI